MWPPISFIHRDGQDKRSLVRKNYRGIKFKLWKLKLIILKKKLPKFICLPFLFATIVYWMSNLYNSASAYFLAVFIIILVSNTAVSFGMIFFYHKIFLNSIITIISFKKRLIFIGILKSILKYLSKKMILI